MQYQAFRGTDLKAALSAVKASLGPNALIETTRHVSNGRAGALEHSYVEILAAAPGDVKWPFATKQGEPGDTPLRRKPAIPPQSSQQSKKAANSPTKNQRTNTDMERELEALKAMLTELNESRPPKERALSMLHAVGIEGQLARELGNGA